MISNIVKGEFLTSSRDHRDNWDSYDTPRGSLNVCCSLPTQPLCSRTGVGLPVQNRESNRNFREGVFNSPHAYKNPVTGSAKETWHLEM